MLWELLSYGDYVSTIANQLPHYNKASFITAILVYTVILIIRASSSFIGSSAAMCLIR